MSGEIVKIELEEAFEHLLNLDVPATWERTREADDGVEWTRGKLTIVASAAIEDDNAVWVHISLSYPGKLPTWDDIKGVRNVILGSNRWAYQVLPPDDRSINIHPYCLHIWAPWNEDDDLMPDFARGGKTI
jgi:hypothetical protein